MPIANLTANDLIVGAPIIDAPTASYYSILEAGPLITPPPVIERPRLVTFYPWRIRTNWERGLIEEIAFRTEIITSRDGSEQRIAQRVNPRYNFRYSVRVGPAKAAELERNLARRQAFNYGFLHPRATTLADRGHPAARGFIGRFEREPVVTARTDRVLDLELNVAVNPGVYGGDYMVGYAYPDADTLHNGLEVLTLRPNWADPVRLTFSQMSEIFDLQRGVRDFNTPERFTNRLIQCGFMIRNEAEENRLLGLFYRMRGQQKSFYMADPLSGLIIPTGSISSGSSVITVAGPELVQRFATEWIYRNIAIRTRTGMIYRRVSGITPNGANSRINLATTLPAIPASEIIGISWLLKMRFAADSLVLNWETDTVARTTLNLRPLEDT